jgi:N-acetyl-gamma-glutamylphosphate reductase
VIERHGLRGFDGIHLASALRLEVGMDEAVTMVAADDRLLRAAAGQGLATLNIETGAATPRPSR